jgi:hypothetical protein
MWMLLPRVLGVCPTVCKTNCTKVGNGIHTIFTVVFADGSRQAYGTGNAVDFIRYPEGKGENDVIDVLPTRGEAQNQ